MTFELSDFGQKVYWQSENADELDSSHEMTGMLSSGAHFYLQESLTDPDLQA